MRNICTLTLLVILSLAPGRVKTQNICTFAGNGIAGYSGDGGSALQAQIYNPFGFAIDHSGNVYFADVLNHVIRKVDASGIITTFAGTAGVAGYGGDGGPATSCQLYKPYGMAFDAAGNMFIADCNNNRIRKISPGGIITTIAGTGATGFSGDGGPAVTAILESPRGITVDANGNIYFADNWNLRIRRISTSGIITTVAGNGTFGYSGDGGPAINAQLKAGYGVCFDHAGNLYISDILSQTIRMVDVNEIIRTVAGDGNVGYSGDGGPATMANLNYPYGVFVDQANNIYIPDTYNNVVRMVDNTGIITTICGDGTQSSTGDGGPAIYATLNQPAAIIQDASGHLYISEIIGQRVRIIGLASCLTTGVNENAMEEQEIGLSPNPNNGEFKLSVKNSTEKGMIVITDALGRKVHQQEIANGENNIVTSGLSKGIYYYTTIINSIQAKNNKLIIQ
jgi:sugar lactone lactonase YvrE